MVLRARGLAAGGVLLGVVEGDFERYLERGKHRRVSE